MKKAWYNKIFFARGICGQMKGKQFQGVFDNYHLDR